ALEAIKLLPEHIKNHQITKLEIPTVFHKSSDKIADKLEQEYFDAVIAIGQAGGRFNLTPERVGININDARIPDNENNQPIDIPIQQDGAPAYFSNLPVKKMTQAIKDAGIPAALSNTAGTFVCNHILYQLGYLQATKYPDLQFGFIHVPFIPEQVIDKPDKPSMSLSSIVTGLEAAIGVISEDNQDIKKALGEIH
ncbi:pyroglutamyl-peptidase I, partial [Staphylococcus condimenti]